MANYVGVKYISLMNVVRTTTSTTYTNTADREPIWLYDAGVYDAVDTIKYQGVMRATSGDTSFLSLFTIAGVEVTGAEISTTSTTNVIVTSADIEANLVDDTAYQIKWKKSGTAGTSSFDAARVLIAQNGAMTKTETVIEIAEDNNVPSTSYAAPSDYAIFLFESARWGGTVNVYLEACLHNNSAGDTTSAALFDITAGSQVSSSEVTHTGNTVNTRKRSSAITLIDGHEYRADIKGTATSDDVASVEIIIDQSGTPGTTDNYITVLNTVTSGVTTSYTYQNRLVNYSASEWAGDTVVYKYETTMKVSVGAETGTYNLNNDTDATELAASTTTSTTYVRSRDTSVTMPGDDSNSLNSGRKVSVGAETGTNARSFLIVQVDWGVGATAKKHTLTSLCAGS